MPPATTRSAAQTGRCSPPSSGRASTTSQPRSPRERSPSSCNDSPSFRSPPLSSRRDTGAVQAGTRQRQLARRPARPARGPLPRSPPRLRRLTPLRRRLDLPLPHHRTRRRHRPKPERRLRQPSPPAAPAVAPNHANRDFRPLQGRARSGRQVRHANLERALYTSRGRGVHKTAAPTISLDCSEIVFMHPTGAAARVRADSRNRARADDGARVDGETAASGLPALSPYFPLRVAAD